MKNWRQSTLRGLKWQTLSQILTQIVSFGASVLLARMLAPEDFGYMAMIVGITGFVQIFSDLGLGAALIQRKEIGDGVIAPVFWLNVLTGFLLCAVIAGLAPLMGRFYAEPGLVPLVRVVALTFLVSSVAVVPRALAQRELLFGRLATIEIVATTASRGLALWMALRGLGVWSLVALTCAQTLVRTCLLWVAHPVPIFVWKLNRPEVAGAMRFGSRFLGFNLLYYWVRNLDNILIGRVHGPLALGYYSRAYQVMLLPVVHLSHMITNVMFPALSRIQDDHEKMKRVFLKATGALALVTVPIMVGVCICADTFVLALFGPKWAPSIPILRILALAGLLQPVTSTFGWLFTAKGRTDVMFRWGAVALAVTATGFLAGLPWGARGVAIGYAVACTILIAPGWIIPGRLIGLRFREMLRCIVPILAAAGVMAAALLTLRPFWPDSIPIGFRLLGEGLAGIVVYAGVVCACRLEPYRTLRDLVRGREFI